MDGDYTTPNVIRIVSDIGSFTAALAAMLGLVLLISKFAVWLDRRKDDMFARKVKEVIEPIIKEATLPIQPGENGGSSLADIHRRLDGYDGRFSAIEAVLGIKERREPNDSLADLR